MIQGVREVFEMIDQTASEREESNSATKGKIVLIGMGLAGLTFEESLAGVLKNEVSQ